MHKNLMSANIYITSSGLCKLGGFQISEFFDDLEQKTDSNFGNSLYLSPEVIERKPYDQNTDMWALGIILYEMCELVPPFDNSDLTKLHASIC